MPGILLSATVLALAYAIALADFGFAGKTAAFGGLVFAYLAAGWLIRRGEYAAARAKSAELARREETARALDLLDEACSVFGGALGLSDSFRLAASRIGNICSVHSVRLYLLDESRMFLRTVQATAPDAELSVGKTIPFGKGLVGAAYESGVVGIEDDAVVIPLINGANAFGVLELVEVDRHPQESGIYDTIGSLCSRLILSAITKDQARDNALVDGTTDFPNERAFRIVLENQTAEAQRDRGDRALTVLAVDIRKFDELNQTFGHAAGDRVLRFAASTIKDSLRAMDFISRSRDDEFLIALPTADAGTSREIVERIRAGFVGHKIVINETQAREVTLNIGAAAFGIDGETPQQLIGMARLRKQESKTGSAAKVLAFPQEPSGLVN
jgi:diguanylate cyclase (GGDEF)-like protein